MDYFLTALTEAGKTSQTSLLLKGKNWELFPISTLEEYLKSNKGLVTLAIENFRVMPLTYTPIPSLFKQLGQCTDLKHLSLDGTEMAAYSDVEAIRHLGHLGIETLIFSKESNRLLPRFNMGKKEKNVFEKLREVHFTHTEMAKVSSNEFLKLYPDVKIYVYAEGRSIKEIQAAQARHEIETVSSVEQMHEEHVASGPTIIMDEEIVTPEEQLEAIYALPEGEGRNEEFVRFIEASMGLKRILIPGDGNCFFTSLEVAMDTSGVRDTVVNYIEDNRTKYESFTPKKHDDAVVIEALRTRGMITERTRASQIRQMLTHPNILSQVDLPSIDTFEEYLAWIRKNTTYASELEIAAAATVFNLKIRIFDMEYSHGFEDSQLVGGPPIYGEETGIPVYLVRLNNNHFDLLVPSEIVVS